MSTLNLYSLVTRIILVSSIIVTTTTTTTPDPRICKNATHIFDNGKCVTLNKAIETAIQTLSNNFTNSATLANTLSWYITLVKRLSGHLNANQVLTPNQIDTYLKKINDTNINISTKDSIIIAQAVNQSENVTVLGASFIHDMGGQIVSTSNVGSMTASQISAAATIRNETLTGITSLNMLIIDKPTIYEQADSSSNKTLSSSVIVVTVHGNSSVSASMHISLYFRIRNEYRPNVDPDYFCSFYDTTHSTWSEFGCTIPLYNRPFNRYECSCNHTTSFALVWSPKVKRCDTSTQVLVGGDCVNKTEAQESAHNILQNATDPTVIAENLVIYVSAVTNSNTTSNSSNTFTVSEIDNLVSKLNATDISIPTTDSIIIAQAVNQSENLIVLGASFEHGVGGQIVTTSNAPNVTSSNITAAAIISTQYLSGVSSLNMLIIDTPTTYERADNSSNKTLASSVIVVSLQRTATTVPIDICLFFQPLNQYKPNESEKVDYFCSFYDTNNLTWNESGCTKPYYNRPFNRYECSCNHTTSFALIWLPKVPLTRHLNAQDIGSLVFLSTSVLCFLAIIIHGLTIRIFKPISSIKARDLLPLISCAVTIIVFIFYIALTMIVYTKETYDDEKECFLSSSILMFFVYFFLILMFCVKTSVGYFNYVRFVRLFPEPSYRGLFVMLAISFLISITWVAFAVGFNSNSSFQITQLYPHKLCWFNRNVIYYFLTIPVGVFLLINSFILLRVSQRIINHVRDATSSHQSYKRMKRCVLVLLSSCATQGIGWLLGPVLTFVKEDTANVLIWLFNIFNGLEGFWAIILYIVIRSQRLDEQKRVMALKDLKKSKSLSFTDREKSSNKNVSRELSNDFRIENANSREQSYVFDDRYNKEFLNKIGTSC
ncbi:unnamed protein product [Rotaria sp. Silwood1]|nr:unnamed protein product [Rotaria sp. Silwood1]